MLLLRRFIFPLLFMGNCFWLLLLCFVWSSLILGTHQLQSSQTQVLLQLRKQLEYPNQLEIWKDHTIDFCYLSSSTQVNLTCHDNFVSELKITGDKTDKVDNFIGLAIPSQTLSGNFSLDSFVATLARLTSLRILSLVSLGIWGPLPDKIHRLSSLECLDLSSNYLFGSVPPKISTMVNLQTLILDDNFFNDTVPDCFDSLSNLSVLSLSNNNLRGPFPSSVQKVFTLTDLDLSSNEISGKLPNLDSLNNLKVLDLSMNRLDSNLPPMPKGLITLLLSNNSFSSEIPRQYSQLTQLRHLDMSFNGLTGTPPAAIFSLPNIIYLNLASNRLGGSLPRRLRCSSKLQLVDISNNSLTGGLPYCLSSESENRVVKFDGNCLSIDLQHQRAESSCARMPEKTNKSAGRDVGILAGVICGIIVFVTLLGLGFLIFKRFRIHGKSDQHLLQKSIQENSVAGFSPDILNNARLISQAAKLGSQALPPCRSFTLEELKEATNSFDNATILGEGSYGQLYKGRLGDGCQVAIRCITSSKKYTNRNLKLRLDLLAKLRHPNLVCLLGHCTDGEGEHGYKVNKVFLVYEYISHGDLRTLLHEDNPGKVLNWSDRLTVLISIAKAVQFLHTGVIPGFFHNRLKANNILMNEHGIAKLSDYGLSIISEDRGKLEEGGDSNRSWQMARLQDDVYSFGFILLESLVASSVSHRRDALLLDELASCNSAGGNRKLINPAVLATCTRESLSVVISIANKCISESWNRPSFEDILWNLQYAAQVQATEDGTKV